MKHERQLPTGPQSSGGRLRRRTPNAPRRTPNAFTLIELLLVMVILAVLAAVVVPKFTGQAEKSRITAAKADLATIRGQLNIYETQNSAFPTTEQGLAALVDKPSGQDLPNWTRLMDTVKNDPWGHPYIYRFPGSTGHDYDLLSCGPDGHEGGTDDINAND